MDDRGKIAASPDGGAVTINAVQLGQLALPVPGPRTTAVRRLPLPPAGARPKLHVITTPPEVRDRWLRWVAIRQSALLTFFITFAVIAVMAII